MRILIDANLLLRSVQPEHPQHGVARNAITKLRADGHELVIVPQVIYEFWVVATRPLEVNGLGLSAARAETEITAALDLHALYQDDDLLFEAWRALVNHHEVVGKQAHDARLVAAMVRHGVTHLLTFNAQDFARFSEIVVLTPTDPQAFPPAVS
ncbi:type II toxin-antitoxin system VapC family toxin [Lacipirellula sp.]|uniref:type II toxin-antitoxin system VapC family toxin n=1 Tax=Lacipirellula sp. TaxID=2691419 RepID=UPI003D0C27D4